MNEQDDEFDKLKEKTLEIIYEIESLNCRENILLECVQAESCRADAELSKGEAARRAAAEARANAAGVGAGADRALAEHSALTAELVAAKIQLGIIERERPLLEQRCSELSLRVGSLQQELERLSSVQTVYTALQRTYSDLEGQVKRAIEETKTEQLRLQEEYRRIEGSVAGGVELRERARRAGAAHARERRLADAEFKQATDELHKANAELTHLKTALSELQQQHTNDVNEENALLKALFDEEELIVKLEAELETVRSESQRLHGELYEVLADNMHLAARIAAIDNPDASVSINTDPQLVVATDMTAVDSFLNEL